MAKYRLVDQRGKKLRTYDPLEIVVRSANDPLLSILAETLQTVVQTAFRPAAEIEAATGLSHKQLLAFCKKHPSIRTQRPWERRLEVHAGDFLRVYRPAVDAGFKVPGPILDEYVAE